ncbi:transcription initiation factor IIA subunit 2 isoform X2 [Prosopis cineraria]|uniref:transcription initiation factor IIA subunit 2 isoform X2 n=1 Tax=Prosopis cineraria TaxID=364024 RepID=UPI0024101E0E|nr:transcription initiation factor IIA subunit 2 isoform X2 [Prosopis cineraria]
MATFELYRRSTIGMCLTETLDEMVQNGTLSPEIAIQVLVQFDKSMTEALETDVKSKVSIKVRPQLRGSSLNVVPPPSTRLKLEILPEEC